MKKRLLVLIVCMLVTMCADTVSAYACTGLYVGKQVSESGAAMIAHSVDSHPCLSPAREVVVERVENKPGRKLTSDYTGFSYALPDTTYKYVSTPLAKGVGGEYASAAMNEMGVAVSATVSAYVRSEWYKADPMNSEKGLTEAVVTDLVAACAATSREGVQVIADAIAKNGNAEENIIMIADQKEAWYIETYTGHQWCALKMPEDMVAVFGNEFMIETIDPNSEDVMYSEGLFTAAKAAGLAVYEADGVTMNIFDTYSGVNRLADYANRRTWLGHTLLAPSTIGAYHTYRKYPLFFAPDTKVGLDRIFELYRNRFEGTEWSPDETGRKDVRVIGTEAQASCHVIEIFDDLPEEMACVGWLCLANAEHSVYLPVSSLITATADSYAYEPADDSIIYDTGMASVNFKRLCALAEQDRVNYGAGVRAYWRKKEQRLIAQYPAIRSKAAALYDKNPIKAKQYITDWTISLQEKTLDEANIMYDELLFYIMNNTETMKAKLNYKTLKMGATPEQVPFTTSLMGGQNRSLQKYIQYNK
ncbi:MAG: C69 family dipeptidase [Clostridia bacterium]|nr:C69 family dipeptidase [Clostridia bacterium]